MLGKPRMMMLRLEHVLIAAEMSGAKLEMEDSQDFM